MAVVQSAIRAPVAGPVRSPTGDLRGSLESAVRALFANGEQGVMYDFGDLSTLTQDSAGTTPAAVNSPIGRVLDKSGRGHTASQATSASRPILRGTPTGSDLLAGAGQFANDTGWALGSGMTISGGKLNRVNSGATANAIYALPSALVSGRVYRITYTVDSISGSLTVGLYGSTNVVDTARTAAGTYVAYLTATSAHTHFRVTATTTTTAFVADSIDILDASADVVTAPYWPQFDGTDDSWATAAIDLTGTDAVTIIASVRKSSDALVGTVAEFGTQVGAVEGAFLLRAPRTNGTPINEFYSRGTTLNSELDSGYAAPVSLVLTGQADISTPMLSLRVNGASEGSSAASQGTGNYGNHVLYIGARTGTHHFFNGRIYRMLVIGRTLTASELALAERWAGQPAGVTLP